MFEPEPEAKKAILEFDIISISERIERKDVDDF